MISWQIKTGVCLFVVARLVTATGVMLALIAMEQYTQKARLLGLKKLVADMPLPKKNPISLQGLKRNVTKDGILKQNSLKIFGGELK